MYAALPPLAVGFFGLGIGYFVYGGAGLFKYPKEANERVNHSMGLWGIMMPGFMQFLTGTYLWLGLTIFHAFRSSPILYMAALAFTAYGVHWFALGYNKYKDADTTVDGFMAIGFLWISIVGALIFFLGKDVPVGILFVLLALIYINDIPASLAHSKTWGRTKAFFQFITGIWLMYLMFAAAMNFALGYHLFL
ncbi:MULTISPECIES: hypothetical protein [Acidiplasma]|uniref:Uncharacterized protein n=2 Tax=Acidiplasma TaxID=507753 RepID=A0A0Q0RSL3_9ARCH|nr:MULTISPECIES: hypothetical protein [unclassified Acidiplasma]KJE50002.1 hypothetical protein TZ01_02780 [Acidiplasma sp. MBA-1]KQB35338.1 hypothetical protein AOG55_07045 [Acidiplasma cupricumulans]WMT55206.1 MAG: hypothetical protein RE470_00830 [Acidiplasma sp.]